MIRHLTVVALLACLTLPALAAPPDLFALKDQLRAYMAPGGEYDRELAAADGDARTWLDSHLRKASKPALVLDIDETALSNREQILADDFAYMPGWYCEAGAKLGFCAALAWDALERAPAIAPTLALFNDARKRGVAVFFITGRRNAERDATIGNLRRAGYAGWTALYMRKDDAPAETALAYKSRTRAQIEAKGFHIVADVGDQQSDLDGGHAGHPVKLPNPFYFVP